MYESDERAPKVLMADGVKQIECSKTESSTLELIYGENY